MALFFRTFVAALICGGAAQAQFAAPCEGGPITPEVIESLHPDAFQTYAEGDIQVFALEVDVHLPNGTTVGVLHPQPSILAHEPPGQGCSAIYSGDRGIGYFGQVLTHQATAEYKPARGLRVEIPVRYFYTDRAGRDGRLVLVINQHTGEIEVIEE